MTKAELYAFFEKRVHAVLSTIGPEGGPQSALLAFAATRDLEIVFDTVSTSRKYRNLLERPACAFVIGWEGEQTAQYEGQAFIPNGEELERYKQVYFAKLADAHLRQVWANIAYVVVRPTWIRYTDYDARPPVLEEMRLGDDA